MAIPHAIFRARQDAMSPRTTIPSGSLGNIRWDDWDTGFDTAVFDDVLVSGLLESVKILIPCVVTVTCDLIWNATFAGNRTVIMNDGWDYPSEITHARVAGSNETNSFSTTRIYPQYGQEGTGPGEPPYAEILMQATQDSGSNQDLNETGSFLEIIVWAASEAAPTALNPGAQPSVSETPAEGVAFAFDSDTLATPIWERVDVT
jgi:hypothetical protein